RHAAAGRGRGSRGSPGPRRAQRPTPPTEAARGPSGAFRLAAVKAVVPAIVRRRSSRRPGRLTDSHGCWQSELWAPARTILALIAESRHGRGGHRRASDGTWSAVECPPAECLQRGTLSQGQQPTKVPG